MILTANRPCDPEPVKFRGFDRYCHSWIDRRRPKLGQPDECGSTLVRRKKIECTLEGAVNEVFESLGVTLAFRRWQPLVETALLPPAGCRYEYQTGSVRRIGRIVEIIRPVRLTLKEILHDPPCRVFLTMRWRIEPVALGCVVRLAAEYQLNHAATLRNRHWDRRLTAYFQRQLSFLNRNLTQFREENVI